MTIAQGEFGDIVLHLQDTCPAVGAILRRAEENRRDRLATYRDGHRLKGLNELFAYLESVERAYKESVGLAKIAFLVRRLAGDLGAALEATLSGHPSLVGDAMRDLIELELLLDDFRNDTAQIEVWLRADKKTRLRQFSPSQLKERYAQREGKDPKSLGISACYSSHSELLHVTPPVSMLGSRGVLSEQHPFQVELCFGEIFEHARRVIYPLVRLGRVAGAVESVPDPAITLPAAQEAWFSTQAAAGFVFGMMQGLSAESGAEVELIFDVDLMNKPAKFAFDATVRLRREVQASADLGSYDQEQRAELYRAIVPVAAAVGIGVMRHWLPPCGV